MKNLYSSLGIAYSASKDEIAGAINRSNDTELKRDCIHILLNADRKIVYDRNLKLLLSIGKARSSLRMPNSASWPSNLSDKLCLEPESDFEEGASKGVGCLLIAAPVILFLLWIGSWRIIEEPGFPGPALIIILIGLAITAVVSRLFVFSNLKENRTEWTTTLTISTGILLFLATLFFHENQSHKRTRPSKKAAEVAAPKSEEQERNKDDPNSAYREVMNTETENEVNRTQDIGEEFSALAERIIADFEAQTEARIAELEAQTLKVDNFSFQLETPQGQDRKKSADVLEHLPSDYRPENGACIDKLTRKRALGELTIMNGRRSDAHVKIIISDRNCFEAYIRSDDSITIEGIPDGIYELLFAFGFGWDIETQSFTRGKSAFKFKDPFFFSTSRSSSRSTRYSTFSVTLYSVPGGRAETPSIPFEEFSKY